MTPFEKIQRQIWDSLMDHERRVFLQLIQDELPTLTLRELGEILTSPAARSVGALPVSSLLDPAAAPPASALPTSATPAKAANSVKRPRRAAARATDEKAADSSSSARGPRLRPAPVAAPQSPVSARPIAKPVEAVEAVETAEVAEPDARREAVVANGRPARAEEAPAAPRRPSRQIELEIAPAADRSNVDVVRNAVSRTLAQHNRFDPETLVLNALRSTGEWIRAKDLRPRVGLQPDDLRSVLNRLVRTGAVRREGEGPDTVYQVFTAAPTATPPTVASAAAAPAV